MSARLDIAIGSSGALNITAMPKAAEDTKPVGTLLTVDGPNPWPPEFSGPLENGAIALPPLPPLPPGVVTPTRPTKTFGTGVRETRPKGPDKAPDDSAPDTD